MFKRFFQKSIWRKAFYHKRLIEEVIQFRKKGYLSVIVHGRPEMYSYLSKASRRERRRHWQMLKVSWMPY